MELGTPAHVIMGIMLFEEGMTGREAFGSAITRHLTRFRQMFPKLMK